MRWILLGENHGGEGSSGYSKILGNFDTLEEALEDMDGQKPNYPLDRPHYGYRHRITDNDCNWDSMYPVAVWEGDPRWVR